MTALDEITMSILSPHKCVKDVLPPEVDLDEVLAEYEQYCSRKMKNVHSFSSPELINVSGLPASGKSFHIRELMKMKEYESYLYISFDEIMESFSDYQQAYLKDREKAFCVWELLARYLGYELLKKGIENRYSILFEHSNSETKHIDLYKEIVSEGYSVCIKYIEATPEIVLDRLKKRERFFPEQQVYERWSVLQCLIPELKSIEVNFQIVQPWIE